MNISDVIFYLLGLFTLLSAVLAVSSRKIFRAAIYLLFSLVGVAGIYFWMEYEFIAAVQIIVYVGGIVVLIIFSIFLTQQAGDDLPGTRLSRRLWAALAAVAGFALVILQLMRHEFEPGSGERIAPSVANIGRQLLDVDQSGMALPFELISMLLLAAMVACIVIAMRSPLEVERQGPGKLLQEEANRFTTAGDLQPVEEEE
jgi:NADH-quinone oxidoreductase subunit J